MEDLMPWEADLSAETNDAMPWEADLSGQPGVLNRMQQTGELSGNAGLDKVQEPIVNQDGTISSIQQAPEVGGNTIDNPSEKFVTDISNSAEGLARGTAQLPLGAMYLGEEAYNAMTDRDKSVVEGWIKENQAEIDSKDIRGAALTGEIASLGGIGGIVTRGIIKAGLVDAAGEVLSGFGADRSNIEIAAGGALAFVGGAAGMALIQKLSKANPESTGAKYMKYLLDGKISEEEFATKIKNIPEDEQAIILAEGDELFKKYFKGAIDGSDKVASKLNKRLRARNDVVKKFVASDEQLGEVSKKFGDMRETIRQQAPDLFGTDGMQANVKALENIYKTDPTPMGTTIRNIVADIGDDMDVSTALDIRENINAMLRKPKVSKNAKGNLQVIKDRLDGFIDTGLKDKPELLKLKDDTIGEYRQVINDNQLGKLLEKYTRADTGVDWKKLDIAIKKNKLNSSNLDYAKPIIKEFSKKFVNDAKIAELAIPSGSGKDNILSLLSKVYSGIIDQGHRLFRTDRAHGLVIQDEIRKSLLNKNNKSYGDYVDSLMSNPKIPKEAKEAVKPLVEEIKQIEYKPNAKTTGDVNLDTKYTTPKGTIAETPSQAALSDSQTELVRETLGKGYSDNVIAKTSELINSKRFTDVMKSTADRMKADDIAGNTKMLQKTLRSEVEQLVSRINKDVGVKLPSAEVEKIYKQKLTKLLEECN